MSPVGQVVLSVPILSVLPVLLPPVMIDVFLWDRLSCSNVCAYIVCVACVVAAPPVMIDVSCGTGCRVKQVGGDAGKTIKKRS